ncbi:DUF397 domain-containing protein [Actinomadura monticuli]|uniref:DUF397 domain-containing protein n=1 Tax=Actinomadura monticuli TaxID=3097367 RepID=A0ABV4QK87_9ACTN
MNGSCLVHATWRKSSQSGSQGADCVEIAQTAEVVAVRDSKDPDGPVLTFGPRAWSAFLHHLKAQNP